MKQDGFYCYAFGSVIFIMITFVVSLIMGYYSLGIYNLLVIVLITGIVLYFLVKRIKNGRTAKK